VRRAAGLVSAALVATACSATTGPPHGVPGAPPTAVAARDAPARPAPTATSSTSTVTAVPTACSNASVVASWPVARQAAEVVAAPVLEADPAAMATAIGHQVGGVLLLGSMPPPAVLAADLAPTRPRPGEASPLVKVDEEGGGVQRLGADVDPLPWAREMAASMSPAQVRDLAERVGGQMRALGVEVDLAPVLDLDGGPDLSASDPDGPRSFGTDPAVATSYGVAFARGLQSAGVVAVAKHFPGLGQASGNTDYGPASTQPLVTLERSGLAPFRAAIAAGIAAVMISNATVPGAGPLPASVSPLIVHDILRGQLHFGGLVMTDSLSAGAVTAAGFSVPAAAVASIEAGTDMVLFGSTLTAADKARLAPGPLAVGISAIVDALDRAVADHALAAGRLEAADLEVLAAGHTDLCSPPAPGAG
jgi:beta-N-acetylhexosaminidase